MKNIMTLIGFIFVIMLVISLNLFDFWGTIGLFVFVLLSITVATALFPQQLMSIFGIMVAGIGSNNNYRLLVFGFLTITSLVMAVKYGPGEPLILKTIQDFQEVAPINENHNLQKFKNYMLWGKTSTNQELVEAGIIQAPVEKSKPRTWFFWKLSAVFFLMFIFYLPFAMSDEVASVLESLADNIRKKQYSLKETAPKVAAAIIGSSSKTTADGSEKMGLIGRIYGSSLASEFTIQLLQKLANLFTRVTT
ncbi:MAG: hypothetical protein WC269_06250 [Candidatus Gracilibacteria bacterium]|jgi:hypothetical protein